MKRINTKNWFLHFPKKLRTTPLGSSFRLKLTKFQAFLWNLSLSVRILIKKIFGCKPHLLYSWDLFGSYLPIVWIKSFSNMYNISSFQIWNVVNMPWIKQVKAGKRKCEKKYVGVKMSSWLNLFFFVLNNQHEALEMSLYSLVHKHKEEDNNVLEER